MKFCSACGRGFKVSLAFDLHQCSAERYSRTQHHHIYSCPAKRRSVLPADIERPAKRRCHTASPVPSLEDLAVPVPSLLSPLDPVDDLYLSDSSSSSSKCLNDVEHQSTLHQQQEETHLTESTIGSFSKTYKIRSKNDSNIDLGGFLQAAVRLIEATLRDEMHKMPVKGGKYTLQFKVDNSVIRETADVPRNCKTSNN